MSYYIVHLDFYFILTHPPPTLNLRFTPILAKSDKPIPFFFQIPNLSHYYMVHFTGFISLLTDMFPPKIVI